MPALVTAEFQQHEDDIVRCGLCPHRCRLREGQCGLCHVRRVVKKNLIAASYGHISSAHIDPIEKKPLYHFYPGSDVFSVGGWGCNFACDFCQNWSISQAFDEGGETATAEAVLAAVQRARLQQVAYTYNEPLVNYEFVRDCARLMRSHGIRNILVTNGFAEPIPAEKILALTDALNLDVKSMDDGFYRRRCRGRLEPVLQFARLAQAAGCHLEITHLLIPGEPAMENVIRLADWIASELGPEIPLHLSAYRPQYRSQTPATNLSQLLEAHAAASGKLNFVYLGNVSTSTGRDTCCPRCGQVWVRRAAAVVDAGGMEGGRCNGCNAKVTLRC